MIRQVFGHEMSSQRTLSMVGEKDAVINVDSKAKTTHSYTAMPMISRAGDTIRKLLLCMQERTGDFPPTVKKEVERLEQLYGNIKVYASKSGKMSAHLMNLWAKDIVEPAFTQHISAPDRKRVLLLADSWSGHRGSQFKERMSKLLLDPLEIPPRTTGELQPLEGR